MIVMSPVSEWISDRYAPRVPTIGGMAVIALSFWVMARFGAETTYVDIIVALVLFGVGFAFFHLT
jgi:hypothetical protein